jgi:hypothetical protein
MTEYKRMLYLCRREFQVGPQGYDEGDVTFCRICDDANSGGFLWSLAFRHAAREVGNDSDEVAAILFGVRRSSNLLSARVGETIGWARISSVERSSSTRSCGGSGAVQP